MADFKDKKKSGGSSGGEGPLHGPFQTKNVWEFLIVAVFLVAIFGFLVAYFINAWRNGDITNSAFFNTLKYFYNWFLTILPYLKILSFFASIFFLYLIFVIFKRLTKINKEEALKYAPPKVITADEMVAGAQEGTLNKNTQNKRWSRVLEHVESKNPNDWKIAIIEADSILDEMTKAMSYHGDTLGERLKNIEVSDFNTLNNAWDAHKVRNQIAHEGANFQLNERETRRVIALYETVFKEFKYI